MKSIYFLRHILTGFLILSISLVAYGQQHATIKGRITTSDGQPAAYVNIGLKNKNNSTTSKEDGSYALLKIKAGSYTVRVNAIGITAQEKNVNVEAGQILELNFELETSSQSLQEITINGGKNKYAVKQSDYVARMPLKNLENPQVYNTVSKEIMDQQIVTDYKQSLRNVPGGGISFGGVNNGFAYTILRGFWTGVRMRNGVAADSWSGIDPAVVERSEAIKGPSGTLYGNSATSFGGLINLVTKQPFEEKKTTIDYTIGSFGLHRIAVDVNTPLNEDKSVLFRLNAAYHAEDSFMDWGFTKRYVVAPSLLYKVNDRLSLTLNAEITKSEMSNLPYVNISALNLKNTNEVPLKYNQSTGSADATFSGGGINFFAKAEYQISPSWKSTTIASLNVSDVDELVYATSTFTSPTTIQRTVSSWPFTDYAYQFQQFFNTDFVVAGLKNKFVLGLDVLHRKGVDYSYVGQEYTDVININQPYSPLSLEKIKAVRQGLVNGFQTSQSTVYAAYASSATNITDQLSVLLGLRVDRLNNKGIAILRGDFEGGYEQTALSPKFGAVYQILKDKLSVFASYTNAFQNNAPIRQPDATTFNAKPTTGNQYEFGIKTDLFENRLTATVSYFNIDVKNALRSNQQGFSFQDSKQKSKGFEIDLSANPAAGLNITAGYGYNKNIYSSINNSGTVSQNRNYLPADFANIWFTYKFTHGALKNFGIGAGSNYVGELNKYTTDPKTDAYFLTDGTLFYEATKVRLGLKVNNIANEKVWGLSASPLATRNVAASIKYMF